MSAFFQLIGAGAAWLLFAGISLGAIVLSCLSISGTWVVAFLAVLCCFWKELGAGGWITVAVFLILAGLIEGAELLAGTWGVQKRGGSRLAGFAALAGGLLGMALGVFIPIPIVGPLIGMVAGSFVLAYAVEKNRLQRHDKALHIATGAVIARLLIILLKVGATLGMILYLIVSVIRA